jgi:hypothetical protein
MSDDDKLAPIIDLAAYRTERAAAQRTGSPLELEVRDGKLWMHHQATMGKRQIGLGPEHIRYLKEQIWKWEQIEREEIYGPRKHRCISCNKPKWIECRGHRSWGEVRTHFAVEVLEYRSVRMNYVADLQEAVQLANDARRIAEEVKTIYRARTSCKRVTSSAVTSWEKVDCAVCLRHKPRVVA